MAIVCVMMRIMQMKSNNKKTKKDLIMKDFISSKDRISEQDEEILSMSDFIPTIIPMMMIVIAYLIFIMIFLSK